MKVVFLDIDGVVNYQGCQWRWNYSEPYLLKEGERGGLYGMDPDRVSLINQIVRITHAKVVLSSAWRHNDDWRNTMKANGFDFEFLDRTVVGGYDGIRGAEIQEFLDSHPDITKYAIIDDDSDMLPHQLPNFFKTSWLHGITDEIFQNVITHLNT